MFAPAFVNVYGWLLCCLSINHANKQSCMVTLLVISPLDFDACYSVVTAPVSYSKIRPCQKNLSSRAVCHGR